MLHGRLIFVGSHGHGHAVVGEGAQKFRDSGIGAGIVGGMLVVVFAENREQTFHGLGVGIGLGAFHEFAHAVAYHIIIGAECMFGIAELPERIVAGFAEIGDGIEQSAVEVEYHQFLHIESF